MLVAILILAAPPFKAVFPISPDGSKFVAPSEASSVLKVVDAKTGKAKRALRGLGFRPYVVRFSSDGTKLAASNTLGEVCVWAADTGKLLFKVTDARSGRMAAYLPLLFSPDGRSLIVGNLHRTRQLQPDIETKPDKALLSLWDTRSGRGISEAQTANAWPVSQFVLVNGGRTLRMLSATITDFDLPLGKSAGREWTRRFQAMSDDGMLASEYTPDWITVWDVASRKQTLRRKDSDPKPIDRLVFAPNRRSFAILRKRTETYADTGYTLFWAELWSYPEGRLLWKTPEARHDTLCFSPDGATVLLPNLQLRKVASGKVLGTFKDTGLPMLGKNGRWRAFPPAAGL